ncbi:hypothetical protein SAMN04488503_1665 [Humidesulfovibrio mexicanus]|jgi:recombinational DNA repair protein (RecF pathway)|uniref:Uncharacterized protein n=1 Tax=Humidesulfovibrio mexicanus TaxID=147047 RepID=A0A238ZYE4_9BACT|nr:hypothetical protein [Humidesulfovibrio mexicanus]SNR87673.1 hypothetical protein SAMN04488503_1665 [Humidesulfovibrio mexicanus]
MIRRSCAACGRPINRTDRFFEASDGTLCQDCQARLAKGVSLRFGGCAQAAMPPVFAQLPELALGGHR